MRSRDFCYWLQGFFELTNPAGGFPLDSERVDAIRKHLALVFKHEIDPSIDGGDPAKKQELDELHQGAATGVAQPARPGGIIYRC